jgi:vitamin B12 transporter
MSPLALLVVLALVPAAARAQRDSARTDSTRLTRLDPLTVTATRVPEQRTKIGSALTVVTADDLRREPPATFAEAVGRVPGAYIDVSNGPGGPAIVRLRGGEEVFSLILMDGVQVNQTGGFFDFQGLALTNVERIEVSRGPASALYGSSAVNGVVHVITRPGQTGPARFRAELSGGGAAIHGGSAQGMVATSGGTPGGGLRYSSAIGVTYDRGIFAVPHDIAEKEASLRVDAAPSAGVALEFISRFMSLDANLPVRDPGATRIPLDPNANNSRDRWVGLTRATFRRGVWSHRFSAAQFRQEFVYRDSADGVSSPDFFVFDGNVFFRERGIRTTLEYQGGLDGRLGATPASLVWGGQWEREKLIQHVTFDGGSSALTLSRPSGALFAESRVTAFGRLHGLLGARLEQVRGLAAELSPRANAVLDLSERVSLRAALGRAYKAPNLQTQYPNNPFIVSNPDLRAETSWSLELGVRARLLPAVYVEASWFRQDYDNLIRTVQYDTSRQINRNVGTARAHGVELDVTAAVGFTRIEANGVYVRTAVLDTTGLNPNEYPLGEELPFRPAVTASVAAFTPLSNRLELAVRGTLVGQQVVLSERFSGRRVLLEPYALLGATLNYHAMRGITTFLKVDNLLDHRYESGFDRRGIPLTATIGMRWGD